METKEIREKILVLLPHWNYRIVRPVKQLLEDGISLEMYYCLLTLRWGGTMTMSDFSRYVQIPKHQMSKMSNRLYEQQFIERIYDEKDRRVIRIRLTDKALEYMDNFVNENTSCFQELLEQMDKEERENFGKAIDTLFSIFSKLALDEAEKK
ncbi:MarR family transcriptional regulator [Agathobaculum sp. TL06]